MRDITRVGLASIGVWTLVLAHGCGGSEFSSQDKTGGAGGANTGGTSTGGTSTGGTSTGGTSTGGTSTGGTSTGGTSTGGTSTGGTGGAGTGGAGAVDAGADATSDGPSDSGGDAASDAGGDAGTDGSTDAGTVGVPGKWPDSYTLYCTTGAAQSSCPASGSSVFGQDGSYTLNTPSYNAGETIVDSVTGLTWQKDDSGTTLITAAQASAYCSALTSNGGGWRLPSYLELLSLMDYGRANPALPPVGWNNPGGDYWTSSNVGGGAGRWAIPSGQGNPIRAQLTDLKRARCVKGPQFSGSYVVSANTARDTKTGLEWAIGKDASSSLNWTSAFNYCENVMDGFDGRNDWRLPSIKELLTIVDTGSTGTAVIDFAVFGATSTAQPYWTSTIYTAVGNHAFQVIFNASAPLVSYGGPVLSQGLANVRCVRGG